MRYHTLMKKMWKIYESKKNILLPVFGVFAVSLIGFLYALLGEGSYVEVHDQMDGEILNYMYQAKYLFQGDSVPEFMNGMAKASMTPPAPLAVLFYKILPPFAAYAAVQWLVVVVGFLGMYFLCCDLGVRREAALVSGIMFAYMPFYPVYGLSALGQPLLVLCYLRYIRGEKGLFNLPGILFYALMSSLTLVGFAWILIGGLHLLYLLCRKKWGKLKRATAALAVLTVSYILTNLSLFSSLTGDGFTTHREEMVLRATQELGAAFWELLVQGGSYSKTYALPVLWLSALTVCIGIYGKHEATERKNSLIAGLLLGYFGIIVFAVGWNSSAVVELRKAVGGMVTYFQADRLYWILPFLSMLLLGLSLDYLLLLGEGYRDYPLKVLLWGMALCICASEGYMILKDSTVNKNIRLLLLDGYEQVTWEGLYMEDVFAEIEEQIEEDKSSYSVVSMGIYPSVALYNGFTCADGYSNNYSLEYKHLFREIMAPELEKSASISKYFDQWGNRCYLATAQRGYDAMVKKGEDFVYSQPDYDFYSMEKLNIRYIFAAAPIQGEKYESLLIEGSPFYSETSYYEVWVYDLQKNS